MADSFADTQSRMVEIAKQRLPENSWQYSEVFAVTVGDYESPVVQEDEEHLYRALRYLEPNTAIGEPLDVKAAAVHVRPNSSCYLRSIASAYNYQFLLSAICARSVQARCGMAYALIRCGCGPRDGFFAIKQAGLSSAPGGKSRLRFYRRS